jgi:hypothetical protein
VLLLQVWRVEPGSVIHSAKNNEVVPLASWESAQMALSFADDIRPLFRDSPDIDSMKEYGLDLSSYGDVRAQAGAIYSRLEDGSMPCDDAWPEEQVELFKRWIDEGMTR